MRDRYTCQYCGASGSATNLTLTTSFRVSAALLLGEFATCCHPCNNRKGIAPEEAE